MRKLAFFISILITQFSLAQDGPYHPAATEYGTNAISYQSSAIIGWATGATLTRGRTDIANTNGPLASSGVESAALSVSDGATVSLGDSGVIVLTFDEPIKDRVAYDFAVFENGFYTPIDSGYFLELAFVEVSSDGFNFVRFPAHSLTQTDVQVSTYGVLNPTNINNLAGKYQSGYGTPFDLAELIDSSAVDIQNITHIRIVDVVGSLDSNFASLDTAGNAINDPYPTDFESGGFDLDAVAVLDNPLAISNIQSEGFQVFPTSFNTQFYVETPSNGELKMFATNGVLVYNFSIHEGKSVVNPSLLNSGIYILRFESESGQVYFKKCVKQ